jgi:Ca-activated chloride channel family protein
MPRVDWIDRPMAVVALSVASAFLLIGGIHEASKSVQDQPPASQEQSGYTISDNVNLVLLDVSVKDPRGGYASGLARNDFKVFEDGRPQQITEFASADTPVTVGLVVDDSGSMRTKRPQVVLAGLAFAKESNPKDEFFVINFNNHIVRGLPDQIPFTDNLQRLRSALYYGDPAGQTALYDAIAYSLKHLELSRQDKRTLIVVSDGGDNVSRSSLPQLMTLIEASRATIYTIGLFDPEDKDANPGVLRKLAKLSGGEFFRPGTLDEIMPVFHKISVDIRNRYSIGYAPVEIGSKRVLRSIRVTAARSDHRKLIVHTRTVYSTIPLSQLTSRNTGHNQK